MLLKRILTAIILIPLVLWVLVTDLPFVFPVFTALVLLLCAWEWAGLSGLHTRLYKAGYLIYTIFCFGVSLFLPVALNLSFAILVWVWMFVAVIFYANQKSALGFNQSWLRFVVGAPLLVVAWLAINILRQQPEGLMWTLYLLLLVWITDIAAYFAGKYRGKHSLAPLVSPNKTWEGAIAGLCAALLFTWAMLSPLPIYWEPWRIFPIAFITAIFVVKGDLVESLLKRISGVKDSGNLLPGHGGVLDRVDGLIAALPLFVLLQLGVFL
ncbi:MAG TPA: phosphatidate cytidylyltransferase [Coxiellaceae bacterium]|nr:phosphatidate cytidylyltransferase [Coxiellaceae bacterium]